MTHPSICCEILDSIRCQFNKSNRKFVTNKIYVEKNLINWREVFHFDTIRCWCIVSKSKFSICYVESTSNRIEYFDHRLTTRYSCVLKLCVWFSPCSSYGWVCRTSFLDIADVISVRKKVFTEDEWLIRIVQTTRFDHKFILTIMLGVTILFFEYWYYWLLLNRLIIWWMRMHINFQSMHLKKADNMFMYVAFEFLLSIWNLPMS